MNQTPLVNNTFVHKHAPPKHCKAFILCIFVGRSNKLVVGLIDMGGVVEQNLFIRSISSLLLCNNSVTSIDNTQLSLYLGYKRKVSYSQYSHIQSYKCIRVLCSLGSLYLSTHVRPTGVAFLFQRQYLTVIAQLHGRQGHRMGPMPIEQFKNPLLRIRLNNRTRGTDTLNDGRGCLHPCLFCHKGGRCHYTF
jgi:hypothetical protein